MFRPALYPLTGVPLIDRLLNDYARAIRQVQSPPVLRMLRGTSDQSLTANTVTVAQFNSATIDSHGWWDSTNYRYTPKEAGYFRVSARLSVDTDATATNEYLFAYIYKSGTEYSETFRYHVTSDAVEVINVADIVYCDGEDDYIDVRVHAPTGATAWVLQGSVANRTSLAIEMIGAKPLR